MCTMQTIPIMQTENNRYSVHVDIFFICEFHAYALNGTQLYVGHRMLFLLFTDARTVAVATADEVCQIELGATSVTISRTSRGLSDPSCIRPERHHLFSK